MEQNTTNSRFHSLDGLRGIAIMAVFLNHLPLQYRNIPGIPDWISLVIMQTIFGSGRLGVAFLFILSGFFMAYLYPSPRSKVKFIQKRYTRLFPLFLSICVANLAFEMYPHMQWFYKLGVIIVPALVMHIIWVYIVQRNTNGTIARTLFLAFVMTQIIVAAVFLASPVVRWIRVWPAFNIPLYGFSTPLMRNGLILTANTTLTFPLNKDIPLFNGVFWSLAAEVLFYVLYVMICVPFIRVLIPKRRVVKIVAVIALLPFLLICYYISRKILGLDHLQLFLFYYFVGGITLGYVYRIRTELINRLNGQLNNKLPFFLPIALIIIGILVENLIKDKFANLQEFIQMLYTFPFTLVVLSALNHKSAVSKILSSRILVFIGIISYSLYLCHMPVIWNIIMQSPFYRPNPRNISTDLVFALGTLLLTICISYVLYYLVEKPYFTKVLK